MLRSLKEIIGYNLQETDDVIGTSKDFLFDDSLWGIRYMVADTGNWLKHNELLITPTALGEPDWQTERLPVKMSREQIEACPPLDSNAPISREYEISYHEHFEIPFYWMGAYFREGMPDAKGIVSPVDGLPELNEEDENQEQVNALDGQLRSACEVMQYSVMASDLDTGRVDDIIVDDSNWGIRYIAIDTGKIIPDRKVLIDTAWIKAVSWETKQVIIDLTHDAIFECPPYNADEAVNREFEVRLYDYHGRPRYWE